MKIDRRRALALIGMGAAAPAAAQAPRPKAAGQAMFRHGVASGDPLTDRVILWTRLDGAAGAVDVRYEVARDPGFKDIAAKGAAATDAARDHTVKVDVSGLRPGTDYFYRFRAAGQVSPVGRTRTLPAGAIPDVVLAVASCSLYPNGYFNAYRAIADLPRVDAVLHLGDYIYEYGGEGSYGMDSAVAAVRPHDPPREILSLADYRRRHAQYKADPQLQAAHARAPWIVVWDDHETANDSYATGAQNHQPETEGDWNARKAVALKAYYEWMPIREPGPGRSQVDAALRSFHFGDLASVIMVETRLGARDKQLNLERDMPVVDGKPDVAAFRAKLNDPARRMMSDRQEAWIGAEVTRSLGAGHAWQVLGNQVVMARVGPIDPRRDLTAEQRAQLPERAAKRMAEYEKLADLKLPVALDMWDGYPVDRERLYQVLKTAGARPIVVSGDSHSFWANELHTEAGERVACEFGTTGITSPGAGELSPGLNAGEVIARANPEVLFNDQVAKGFILLTLTREAATARMMAVSTITAPEFTTATLKTFRAVPDGKGISGLSEV